MMRLDEYVLFPVNTQTCTEPVYSLLSQPSTERDLKQLIGCRKYRKMKENTEES